MKGSFAYELYGAYKSATSEKEQKEYKKKLEKHHKELLESTKELMTRYGWSIYHKRRT